MRLSQEPRLSRSSENSTAKRPPSGKLFYRIVAVDLDGEVDYSPIKELDMANNRNKIAYTQLYQPHTKNGSVHINCEEQILANYSNNNIHNAHSLFQ